MEVSLLPPVYVSGLAESVRECQLIYVVAYLHVFAVQNEVVCITVCVCV